MARPAGPAAPREGEGAVQVSEQEKLFDVLAPAYEVLASAERIAHESDAIAGVMLGMGAHAILDAGCAAGFHAVELARRGLRLTGIDRSAGMIREARVRAAAARLSGPARARFAVADLVDANRAPGAPFDALLCLGNTMASIRTRSERGRVLRAFRDALRSGGMLVLQMRDFSGRNRSHVFPTKTFRRGGEEWIFLRRFDPEPRGVRFLATLLHRPRPDADWVTYSSESFIEPVSVAEWRASLARVGFHRIRFAADLRGTPRSSRSGRGGPDLVILARSA